MQSTEIISKKKNGEELLPSELSDFLHSFLSGETTDYQMSAWLMAVCFQGMTKKESQAWTQLMWKSGSTLPRPHRNDFWIDKHSTGGVGDKTSLLLVPLVLAASEKCLGKDKIRIPMISGRGLGHTGGTLDKLESVPGFSCRKNIQEATKLLEKNGFFMIGQSEDIAPADRKIYALRDATATVESIPLIVSSILSKKLAESLDGIVFDVKVGTGAFMKTRDSARALGQALVASSKDHGLKAIAVLTSMQEPLGFTIGNAMEVLECWEFLLGKQEPQFKSLVVELGTWMLYLASQKKQDLSSCRKEVESAISSLRSQELFIQMFSNQGGNFEEFLKKHQTPNESYLDVKVVSPATGFLTHCNPLILGECVKEMGGGRQRTSDTIDARVGIRVFKKVGEPVQQGDLLAVGTLKKDGNVQKIQEKMNSSFHVGADSQEPDPMIYEVIE